MFLAVRATCREAVARRDEAFARNVEAIEALCPTFRRDSRAVLHWMHAICRQETECCRKLGVEPNAARLEAEGGGSSL